jgi:hypothetical protein
MTKYFWQVMKIKEAKEVIVNNANPNLSGNG